MEQINCMKITKIEGNSGNCLDIEFTEQFKSNLLNEIKSLKLKTKTNRAIAFFIKRLEEKQNCYIFRFRFLNHLMNELCQISLDLDGIIVKFTNALMFQIFE